MKLWHSLPLILLPVIAQQEALQRNQIQQQEQEREQIERALKEDLLKPVESSAPVPTQGLAEIKEDEQTLFIQDVTITGVTLFPSSWVEHLESKYENRELTPTDLDNIRKEITNAYIKEGYITARAVLPDQDLLTQKLTVQVIEGVVERFQPKYWYDTVNTTTAFPGLKGTFLQLRDLEQGLDQINRLKSNNYAFNLRPGKELGSSIILLEGKPSNRIGGSLGFHNFGSTDDAFYSASLSLNYDNPFRLNDQFYYSGSFDPSLTHKSDGAQNMSHYLSYSVPYGKYLATASISYSDRENLQQLDELTSVVYSGRSITWNLDLQRLMYRDQTSKFYLSAKLSSWINKNFINDTELEAPSITLTNASITADYSKRFRDSSSLSLTASYQLGLGIFGGLSGSDTPSGPQADYHLLSLSAYYRKPFKFLFRPFTFSSQADFQYSTHELHSVNGTSIGGFYSVRGFRQDSVAGSSGVYVRNELSYGSYIPLSKGKLFTPIQIQPYLALDIGTLFGEHTVNDLADTTRLVSSATLGVNAFIGQSYAKVFASIPLTRAESMEENDLLLGMQWSYSF